MPTSHHSQHGPAVRAATERLRQAAMSLRWRSPGAAAFHATLQVLLERLRSTADSFDRVAAASAAHQRRAAERASELAVVAGTAAHLGGAVVDAVAPRIRRALL